MVSSDRLASVLETVEDPELPIPITELGMVDGFETDGSTVAVRLVPTFLGCPAQWMIEQSVRDAVAAIPGVDDVTVSWLSARRWGFDRISDVGREALRDFGVTVPSESGSVACPYCGSESDLSLQSNFGSTLCRKLAYCEACRNPVEILKEPLEGGAAEESGPPTPVRITSLGSLESPDDAR